MGARPMRVRLMGMVLVVALLGLFVAAPLGTGAAPPTSGGTATLVGGGLNATVTNLTATVNQLGQVVVGGTFGPGSTFTNAAGVVTQLAGSTFSAILQGGGANASCTILDLVVGPITLNLLGLVIETNQIELTITAVPGPGNLLGNLLCAVANLLNGPTNGNAIANLLNRIFGLLG